MRALKTLLLSAAIAMAVSACATTTSPTGRKQYVGAVSQQQLDQLGAQAFAEVKAKKPQTTDARQRAYVGCVVNALVAQLPAQWRTTGWEYAVFVDKEPNAFALPGGKVGVYTGIFTVARNQDQLAAVIAHEIGHVISRHHEERITRQMQTETGLGLIGALLLIVLSVLAGYISVAAFFGAPASGAGKVVDGIKRSFGGVEAILGLAGLVFALWTLIEFILNRFGVYI